MVSILVTVRLWDKVDESDWRGMKMILVKPVAATAIFAMAGLERAAVWETEHLADRLRDHYDGRPNAHLEQ